MTHLETRLEELFFSIYPHTDHHTQWYRRLLEVMQNHRDLRSPEDRLADAHPQWHTDESIHAMTLYVDLFAGDFYGLLTKLDYFKQLGINLIHLMPLAKPREGNSDGGYAVQDYRDTDPRLGTWDQFIHVVHAFKAEGIRIAIDFVVNHTAKEHVWAQHAAAGEVRYQHYYMMYDTPDIPDLFNQTVPEVLPDIYPGNFTYYPEFKKYVFTSFSEFQWDLNFRNPEVLVEIIDIFLYYANQGIAMVRFDAIPFIWKELHTSCRNLPTAHELMKLFMIVRDLVCPSVKILGEAIVEPEEIYRYFGTESAPECDALYNANLMVNLWNALATQDVRLLRYDNERFAAPHHAVWINYLRCHDDIGWGFSERRLEELGFNSFAHKQFLINFYNGTFPTSFARGRNYQFNPATLDARTNGTLSALIGFEAAEDEHDPYGRELAWHRYVLLTAYLMSHSGIPLIYSGDEWLQPNDHQHTKNPAKTDGRWIHRPVFDWSLVAQDAEDERHHAYHLNRHLIQLKTRHPSLGARAQVDIVNCPSQHLYVMKRRYEQEAVWCLFNFSADTHYVSREQLKMDHQLVVDLISERRISSDTEWLRLAPYEVLWLTTPSMGV